MWHSVLGGEKYLDKMYLAPGGRHDKAIKQDARWKDLIELLLSMGGRYVVTVESEPDIDKILNRGRRWPRRGYQLRLGEPCECHSNSWKLYNKGKPDVMLVTGYALTKDDEMWRQHSWAWIKSKKVVVETTVARDIYYGFALTDEEADYFGEHN